MNQVTNQTGLPLNIGLALSGGGYRAAGFHLGLLSYLDRVDLLKQVKMISTVSGGTFTGAKYTLSLVAGKSFQQFYNEYYDFLKNTKLVEKALEKLSRKQFTTPSERIDLITAVAQVYADTFLNNTTTNEPYRFGDILSTKISLQEVIFNATEFRTGIAFRFQFSANSKGIIGNGNISIPKLDAADIRIADIVAASSCFPGGFEPLAFPGDFNWSNDDNLHKVRENIHKKLSEDIALMDGGIYDNQGIEGLYLADRRNGFLLDLFVISDVDQQSASLYQFPSFLKISDLTLQEVDWLSKITIVLGLLTLVIVGYKAITELIGGHFVWWDIFLYVIPILLALGTIFIVLWGRNIIKNKILPKAPQVGRLAWKDLKMLTIDQVANGIYLRLTSLQAMAGSVFMKRIRSMGFSSIYKQYKDRNRGKLISNLIYELKTDSSLHKLAEVQSPSIELLNVIDAAASMPTTLWFTENNQLDNLIVSGQATTCYNLMVYISRNHGDNPNSYSTEIRLFWDKLVEDWNSLGSNPQILP
jgi:predicted acylesterase/phospholipase RssA